MKCQYYVFFIKLFNNFITVKIAVINKFFSAVKLFRLEVKKTCLSIFRHSGDVKKQFEILTKFIDGNIFDKKAAKWESYGKSARIFSLYLHPIFLTVNFEFHTEDSKIMELAQILKKYYNSGKSPSSLKFSEEFNITLPKRMVPYLKSNWTDQYVDPHLLEFFVYKRMYHDFDRGIQFKHKKGQLEWSLLYDATSKQKYPFFKKLPLIQINNVVK